MLQRFLRLETITYVAFVVFSGAFLILYSLNQGSIDLSLVLYYVQLTGLEVFLYLILVLVIRFSASAIIAGFRGVQPSAVFSSENLEKMFLAVSRFTKDIVTLGIPFVVVLFIFSFTLGELNTFSIQQNRLQDELLFQWDVLLTQTFPAFSLASLQYPEWFVRVVIICFSYLGSMLVLLAIYFLLARPKLFREITGAFFLGLMFMFIGWMMFPALSPQDRFRDNVHDLPIGGPMQPYLENYHPQEEIAVFLEGVRVRKASLRSLPTTTMPSAHVAWAVLLVYYSYRAFRWLVFLSIPFVILSSIGTVLLAQHYFVDIPAGVIIAFISIAIVSKLAARKKNLTALES